MPTYQSYVLCTSPRSGSTLCCRLLKASGAAGDPQSYFHKPSVSSWQAELGVVPDPSHSDREALKAVFATARQKGTANTGLFGLRLQRHSFEYFFKKLADFHPQLPSDRARFEAEFGTTLFIHLTRQDKIQQAVSYVKAQQTGLWHQAPDGTELERLSAPQDPVYDPEALRSTYDQFLKYDQDWSDWFAKEKITPYRVTYDQLSADPQGTLREILRALGKDPVAGEGGDPGIAKLADATNRDWANRLHRQLGLV
ncbi:Stf0 family sulfotransferase [Roseibium sp.]|uniref:Stf0 family sulfotransferase n=1 Tax=Roseibium sp. TaxID=1936156 RepID=UPI003B522B9E